MVSTPVTFVVGAGASKAYGLPLGSNLLSNARSITPQDALYQAILRLAPIRPGPLNDILSDLKAHSAQSIDFYLHTRDTEPEVQRVGKLLIAGTMASRLQNLPTRNPEDEWLGYLLGEMMAGAGSFDAFLNANHVQFVTFNFDSVIENEFTAVLQRTYRNVVPDAIAERFPVLHLHGRLPSLPTYPFSSPSVEWDDWLVRASAAVKIVTDDVPVELIDRANRMLKAASHICCLGFAYDPLNMDQLRINRGAPKQFAERKIFGSAYGLHDGEKHRVKLRWPGARIELGAIGEGCLACLRRMPIIE